MPALTTFLVEDSPVIRRSLIATLEELTPLRVVGFAEDEPHAVQWLGNPANDAKLVIIDLFLHSGSGLGVLEAVHHAPTARTLVVLSNYATEAMRAQCLELGAQRVFDKSTEIDALILYCQALGRNA